MSAVRSSLLLRLSRCISSSHSLLRTRPLAAAVHSTSPFPPSAAARRFATSPPSSSLSWPHVPPEESILCFPDGCDFKHWLVVMEEPEGEPSRDEIIDGYIKTLAQIVGSEEEARMKIYSVSTRCYFAFGALVSEELSCKLKELPGVRGVIPDSYQDMKKKEYGG